MTRWRLSPNLGALLTAHPRTPGSHTLPGVRLSGGPPMALNEIPNWRMTPVDDLPEAFTGYPPIPPPPPPPPPPPHPVSQSDFSSAIELAAEETPHEVEPVPMVPGLR